MRQSALSYAMSVLVITMTMAVRITILLYSTDPVPSSTISFLIANLLKELRIIRYIGTGGITKSTTVEMMEKTELKLLIQEKYEIYC